MTVCIKDLIQNMNLVVGCDIGCAYGELPVVVNYFFHEEVKKSAKKGA